MGTRSVVKFYEDDEFICNVYQQYDGYIDGVGKELCNFLKEINIINGIGFDQNVIYKYANGMGCLSSQFIEKFKHKVGGLYLYPERIKDVGYDYIVNYDALSKNLKISVYIYDDLRFNGNLKEYIDFIDNYKEG